MAEVKLTANTSDAQRKIKQLKQDIDKLDKQVKAPKKYNLQTKGFNTTSVAGGAGLSSKSMGMAVAGGSMLGGIAASAFSKLVNVLSAAVPALLKFGLGIDNVNGLMKKWGNALEAYSNAPERALSHADSMDALDDERRAHGTKTLAEEFGYSEAYRNVGGNEFNNQILTRIETLVEQAKAGNIEAIKTISTLDTYKGLTAVGDRGEMQEEYAIGSHLHEMNTYEILAEILRGYHGAKQQGDYTKIDALTKFLGRRGIGIANKLGDVTDVERQAQLLAAKWNETHGNETAIMNAAAESELIRSQGRIYNYGVPAGGEQNIITGANNEVEAAKLAYEALGKDSLQIGDKALEEMGKDWDKVVEQAISSPLGEAIKENVVKPLEQYSGELSAAVDTTKEIVAKFSDAASNIDKLPERVIEPAKSALKPLGNAYNSGFDLQLKWASGMLSPFLGVDPTHQIKPETPTPSEGQIRAFGDNAYKPLVEDDPMYNMQREFEQKLIDKVKAAGEAIPDFLDPATFNKRFFENYKMPNQQQDKQQNHEGEKQAQAVVTALNEVATNLKTSTAATNHMTQTLQKGLTITTSNGSTATTATFA